MTALRMRMAGCLRRRQQQMGWPELPRVQAEAGVWVASDTVPQAVASRCLDTNRLSLERWRALTALQRYALMKLAASCSGKNWCAALDEFLPSIA